MTPHEEHHPRRPASDWGTTLLLGVAAVALVGILVLTTASEA
jgi:hypothetical protein